ncbi:MAG: beta-ketoacyl-ACP synthase II [Bacteroidota bacterium]|nr:beta-ketoacyl-ACP synthase II [Bacteroidota bacterium]
MKKVVVTGLGALTPIGNNVRDFWKNLLNGKSGAAPITRFDASNSKTKFACEVKNFEPLEYMEKSEVRKMDLFTQYAFAAVDECLKDSSLDLNNSDLNRIGVVWATGVGGIQTLEDELFNYCQNGKIPRFSPFFITKMIPNIASGQISIRYGLRGASYATSSACASSNNAIVDAYNLIRLGKADAILAGGSEAAIIQSAIGGFNSLRALSVRNDSPETASRPFDRTRDGFVMGEGAGVLLLEELEHAVNRGARIYCELSGCGFASDAYHITASHPEGYGASYAMEEAIREAGLTVADVDYINAHATSTPVGDISECKAISRVFNDCLDKVHVGATKSMTGHLLGAAGAVEAIAAILAIHENVIPPTINLTELDPEINPELRVSTNECLKKEVNVALNNTFGFGGHIVVSLFKKYSQQ